MKHFILIDDDEIFNFIHNQIIRQANPEAKITIFQSALYAIEFLKNNQEKEPDYIFLDVNMPEMNGFEFLEEFNSIKKSFNNSSKIFMVTSSLDRRDHERAREFSEVVDFIDKPLSIEFIKNLK